MGRVMTELIMDIQNKKEEFKREFGAEANAIVMDKAKYLIVRSYEAQTKDVKAMEANTVEGMRIIVNGEDELTVGLL